MMYGPSFSGNLFFDPLASGLATGPAAASTRAPGPAGPAGADRKRGVQTAAEHKALRAASLSRVSKDLERMFRERNR